MALQQHHLLSDVTVRGFVAGATNILFRQQRHLSDAIVDVSPSFAGQHFPNKQPHFIFKHLFFLFLQVEEAAIQIQDPELRKILSLTTADLRFADYLVKHVTENRDDVFLDGTGWEGGDEWIRAQFTLYLHSLLSSVLQQGGSSDSQHHVLLPAVFLLLEIFQVLVLDAGNDSKSSSTHRLWVSCCPRSDNERLLADYGVSFIAAWKITHNLRVWYSNKHPAMAAVTPG